MNFKNKQKNNLGFSIIEVIIVCSVISITVFALMSTAGKSVQVSNYSLKQAQATLLIEEGVEAVKSIRDNDWTSVSADGTYYLFFNTTTNLWNLNTSSITPNGHMPTYPIDSVFNRTIIISSVERDSNDNIVESGSLDSGTKKVTVTVSFDKLGNTIDKSLSFYLTNIFN